tara:strand:+ start:219 stop:347 length:129 start_codon:yes stop_codon:yes gene_type:complete
MTKKYALCLYGKVGSPKTWKDGINKQKTLTTARSLNIGKKIF